jgi:ABC-type cobalamin transport system ATPase subunit
MLGRLIAFQQVRNAESRKLFTPNTNDSTILKAHIAGFVDSKGQLTQQGIKLMNFFSMKSTKVD